MLLNNTNAGHVLKNKLYNLQFSKKEKKLINGIYNDSINKLKSIIPYDTYNNILSVKDWLIKRGYFVGPLLKDNHADFYD